MAQGDRQQESLETLKLINAASTALRLYPGDSIQVISSVENAYLGIKSYIRNNKRFRFSLSGEGYMMNGKPVDNPTRDRLQLLTFCDQLQKMDLKEFVLSKRLDRKTFRQILSVFSASPDQINKAGGNRSFISDLKLTETFPEHYSVVEESAEEKEQKDKINSILRKLSGGYVRPEYIMYLVGRQSGKKIKHDLQQNLQTPEQGGHIVAATAYSLIQILNKDHIVAVAPAFSKALETISTHLDEIHYPKVSARAATLLMPYLDETSVLMLICQDFSSPFGRHFYDALLAVTDSDTLTKVLAWIREQQKKGAAGNDVLQAQLRVVTKGADTLLATPRGKQMLAKSTADDVLHQKERGQKEKRVQAGITALAKGDLSSLENEEVCSNLLSTIEKLLEHEKEDVAAAILQNMVKGLTAQSYGHRDRLAQAVGGVAHRLAHLGRWEWLEKLTPVCLAWIRENEVADNSFQQHVEAMQAMMNHSWFGDNIDLSERILTVFYHIRSGALEKTDAIREMLGRVQDKNVDLALLQGYLDRCFETPVDEMICRKIVMQGPVATRFLLDTLIDSDTRSHRIRLLKILSEMEYDLVPVLLERLPDPMPWFGKRNIIRLLGETGVEGNAQAVLEYVSHEDLRVQQEAVRCIVRIGKESTEEYLLEILPLAGMQVKIQVVKYLRNVATEKVVGPLGELLAECQLYSGSEKPVLAMEIIKTLGASGTVKAFPVLQRIVNGDGKQFGQQGVEAAKLAISSIREQGKGNGKAKTAPGQQAKSTSAVSGGNSGSAINDSGYELITTYPEEKEVYELLQKDRTKSAIQILIKLIEKVAHLKKIHDAELLRLRLIDIDPMALSEIIKAAEYIEAGKSNSVDQDHILIWSDLYDLLSTEEFNAFYNVLEHESHATEEVIIKQGDPQLRLLFINKGRLRLFYNDKESETLVKTLGPGNVFGGASFFDESVWTLNAITMGLVDLSTLSMERVEEWKDEYPELEAKLKDYCQRFDRVNDFFVQSGAERRDDERRPLSGSVHLTLLNEKGDAIDSSISGECIDISPSGFSFSSRITQRKQARSLLGHHVEIVFGNEESTAGKTSSVTGTVMAVRELRPTGLGRSVHIRFDTVLETKKMLDIMDGK